jgi:putative phosphoesterase
MDRRAIAGTRFALLSDTHDNLVDWPAALAAILAAAGKVDAFIHCGDLSTLATLDALAAVAPVFATRSAGDPPADGRRLVDGPRVLEAPGTRIGVTFALAPSGTSSTELFGERLDVIVYGGTHQSAVVAAGGTLFVNPGSPTLAKAKSLAILSLEDGCAKVEIVAVS